MLLPSAFPCDPFLSRPDKVRPKLPSFSTYQPQPQSAQTGLLAACRSLQSILGGASARSQHPSKQSTLYSRSTGSSDHPLQPHTHIAQLKKPLPLKPQPARGVKKRRRDVLEDDMDEPMSQNPLHHQENATRSFSTPKRQCRVVPLAMPLGLCVADFRSLDPPANTTIELEMPSGSPADTHADTDGKNEWTAADDRALVETVLEKLRLSKHEWNDCAKRLGKDKDSLGKRWNVLLGGGDVGLRRGGKRAGRTDLDIRSW